MKYIKNGKIVLNGTMKEQDLEDKLLKALEIIVDKEINIARLKFTKTAQEYNKEYPVKVSELISQRQFELVKEIIG